MIANTLSRTLAIGVAAGALAFAGACGSNTTAPGSGTMVVQLTDAPFVIDSVKSADVFVIRVDGRIADVDSATAAKGAGADSATTSGGWTTIATPNATFNLLAYQNGATIVLGQKSVPAGSYLGFRLVIDPSRSSVTLKSNQVLTGTSSPNVSFPSGSTSGIKINVAAPVVIAADGTTTLVVDFDLANSFVLRGNSIGLNGLLFKPVIHATMK